MTSGQNKLIIDYSISDFLWAFWDISHIKGSDTTPIAMQFWFIRNLMVTVILTPLIYICLKRLNMFFLVLLGYLWVFQVWPALPGLGIESLFFFSLGGYISIYNKGFILKSNILKSLLGLLCIMFLIGCVYSKGMSYFEIMVRLYILCAFPIILFCAFKSRKILQFELWKKLSKSSFFIFAFHFLPLILIIRLMISLLKPDSSIKLLVIYFSSALLIIVVGYVGYTFLRKYSPKLTAIITGGR